MENETPKTPDDNKSLFPINWAIIIFFIIILMGPYLFTTLLGPKEIDWPTFKNEIYKEGDVEKIGIINQEKVEVYILSESLSKEFHEQVKNKPGPQYSFNIGSLENFENKLSEAQEEFQFTEELPITYSERTNWLSTILAWTFPLLLLVGFWYFMLKRPGGMKNINPYEFGKSKAKLFEGEGLSRVTFEDVAGLESAKVEVMEIVSFLKNPETYTKLGAKIPKGVMLVGPPGTGKTLLAKAVAGEAKVPFFSISGSEFVEMFVGVGASRVRDLFRKAKEKAPSIIFIDEIDAVGKARGNAASFFNNDERESTLNQLLAEMDGYGENPGVIVMAATNRPDILDKALLRPGRFDRHIYLELPSKEERKAIFGVHAKRLALSDKIDFDMLASQTPGFSGADIANICNEAALIAARKSKSSVEQEDFSEATDRIIGGLERKGKIVSEKEKRTIAYHESGHATVSWYLEDSEDLVKVSIIPRGKALGAAWYAPEEHFLLSESQMVDNLTVALGGRAGEELVFGEVTSGALDDLEKATKQAYAMVAFYGLNSKVGNVSFYDSTGHYDQSLQRPYGEKTAELIDEEVRGLIHSTYQKALDILRIHRKEMETLAEALLKKEVIEKEELEEIFGKHRHHIEPEIQ